MKPKYTHIGNVVLVGTSHIADEAVKNVKAVIEEFNPCIVGVELDKQRFRALLSQQKSSYFPSINNIRRFGVKGTIFALIGGYVSDKLAKTVGAKPGDDMLSALYTAREHDLTIALLDQPIHITLNRFSRYLTWKEKWNFLVDIIKGVLFPRRELKKYGLQSLDLRKVPAKKLVKVMVNHVKERYPNVYRVLIAERNEYMVRKIHAFQKKYPGMIIVAVVGAGHEDGMNELLQG